MPIYETLGRPPGAHPAFRSLRSPSEETRSALLSLALPKQLRQPCDVGGNPPRLLRQYLRLQSMPPTGWLSQKKNKPGECEAAAKQDGPVPHIKAKKSAVRHDRDELRHEPTSRNRALPPRRALSGQEHGYYMLNWLIRCLHSAALAWRRVFHRRHPVSRRQLVFVAVRSFGRDARRGFCGGSFRPPRLAVFASGLHKASSILEPFLRSPLRSTLPRQASQVSSHPLGARHRNLTNPTTHRQTPVAQL
jgi:hypothetical protein